MQQTNTYFDSPYQNEKNTAPAIKTWKWFSLFALFHLVVWTLVPTLMRGTLPWDTAEGVAWGNIWAWGYEKHPFLAPWLTAGVTDLFHVVGWPIYLLSEVCVVICFWGMWRLACRMMPAVHALIGVVILEGIYYYTTGIPQFNPNVMMLPTWALTSFVFYLAMKEQKMWQWVLTGVFVGLAMLSKYESLLLVIAMFIFTLINSENRKIYRRAGVYVGIIVSFLVFLPNFIWLVQHNFLPIIYTENRLGEDQLHGLLAVLNHIWHPLEFAFEQIGAFIPVVVLFSPLFFNPRTSVSIGRFNKLFLWYIGIGPLLLALLYSVVTGAWLHSLWAFPLLSFGGIILVAWYKPVISKNTLKRFLVLFVAVACLIAIVRGSYLKLEPYIKHRKISALFPGQGLAKNITDIWHQHYHDRLQYIAGYHGYIIYVSAYSKDKPIVYFNWDKQMNPWINEKELRKAGAMFIWPMPIGSKQSVLSPKIAARFPCAKVLPAITLKLLTKAKIHPMTFGVAILPPAKYCKVQHVSHLWQKKAW